MSKAKVGPNPSLELNPTPRSGPMLGPEPGLRCLGQGQGQIRARDISRATARAKGQRKGRAGAGAARPHIHMTPQSIEGLRLGALTMVSNPLPSQRKFAWHAWLASEQCRQGRSSASHIPYHLQSNQNQNPPLPPFP